MLLLLPPQPMRNPAAADTVGGRSRIGRQRSAGNDGDDGAVTDEAAQYRPWEVGGNTGDAGEAGSWGLVRHAHPTSSGKGCEPGIPCEVRRVPDARGPAFRRLYCFHHRHSSREVIPPVDEVTTTCQGGEG